MTTITVPTEGQIHMEHPNKGKFRLICPSCDNGDELYLKHKDVDATQYSIVVCGVCGTNFKLNTGTREALT